MMLETHGSASYWPAPVSLRPPFFHFPEARVLGRHLPFCALVQFFHHTQLPCFPKAPQRERALDDRRSQLAHHVGLESGLLTDLPAVVRSEVEAVARAPELVHLAHVGLLLRAQLKKRVHQVEHFRRVGGGVILDGRLHQVELLLDLLGVLR